MNYYVIVILCLVTNIHVQSVFGAGKILQLKKRDTTNDKECNCEWSGWMNNPEYSSQLKGDNNSYAALRGHYDFCNSPSGIECRSTLNPQIPFDLLQTEGLDCDVTSGLVCVSRPRNKISEERPFYCDDYEIRVKCCVCPPAFDEAIPINLINFTTAAPPTVLVSDTMGEETTEITEVSPPFALPLSIIIVIVVALLLVCGIVLCVVFTHKDKKEAKFSNHYMSADSYLQRPVSFTEVDLMRSHSPSPSSSPKSNQSESSERRAFRLTVELSKAKLELLQPEPEDEPDVVSSTKRTNHEPILRHATGERRWLPDEHEQRRDVNALRSGKKTLFSRAMPPPPVLPPSLVKKSVAFPDEDK